MKGERKTWFQIWVWVGVKSKIGTDTPLSSQNAGSCDGKWEVWECLESSICWFTVCLVCFSRGSVPARVRTYNERFHWREGQKCAWYPLEYPRADGRSPHCQPGHFLSPSMSVSSTVTEQVPRNPKPKPQRRSLEGWAMPKGFAQSVGIERSTPQLSGWGAEPPHGAPTPWHPRRSLFLLTVWSSGKDFSGTMKVRQSSLIPYMQSFLCIYNFYCFASVYK